MTTPCCKICDSPLKTEIEKKDTAWNADKTIKWAKENGVGINRAMLARHRASHVEKVNTRPEQAKSDSDILSPGPEKTSRPGPVRHSVDDLEFLDAVRDRAYEKLLAGEFELKLDSAFKAIEIKYKISDESGNEKLLMEILSEIRADELARGDRRRSHFPENR